MHLLRSGHGFFFHTVPQITSTSCTETAELLILMVCPTRLCSISSHGSGIHGEGSVWIRCLVCVCAQSLSYVYFSATPWTASHLYPWDFPGKNTGLDFHLLLQGIFLTQALNLNLCIAGGFFTTGPLRYNRYSWRQVYKLLHTFSSLSSIFKWLFLTTLFSFLSLVVVWKNTLPHSPGRPSTVPINIALYCIFISQLFWSGIHPWSKTL